MIIVENGESKVTAEHLAKLLNQEWSFDDFLKHGLVEYLDVNEENDSLIALYEEDINANSSTTVTHGN